MAHLKSRPCSTAFTLACLLICASLTCSRAARAHREGAFIGYKDHDGLPPPPPPLSPPKTAPCRDQDVSCGDWAEKGECEANPGFMKTSCELSCGVCNVTDLVCAVLFVCVLLLMRDCRGAGSNKQKNTTRTKKQKQNK